MKIILLRHGETIWNKEGRLQGCQDIPLSDIGAEQIRTTGAHLAASGIHIDHILSSPLQRARKSAEIIAAAINYPGERISTSPLFLERGFGECEGFTYEEAMAGFEAGATHVTHLFNGMEPLHHRNPGLVGAALTAGANVELICDGLHIHPAVIMGMHRMFGEKLVIISDSLRCAGLSDGHYDLAGQEIVVTDGKATLLDGTIAGSSSNLHEELKNVVSYGMSLEAAIKAMTEAPAKAIGEFDNIGSLDIGKAADMLLLDENLEIKAVIIDGEVVIGEI